MADASDEAAGHQAASAAPQAFRVLYEKLLQVPVETSLFSWCPTMDLMTFSPDPKTIMLYRITGQLVWRMTLKGANAKILKLAWKPDGKLLALGCADGSVRICDPNNGKLLHQRTSPSAVVCLNWVSESKEAIRTRSSTKFDNLINVDVTSIIPKLSPIPASLAPDSLFATKFVMDSVINTRFDTDSPVPIDILVSGEAAGNVLFNIFGNFTIANLPFPPRLQLTAIDHCTTDNLSFHGFLARMVSGGIVLLPLRVHFIRRFGADLALISFSSTRIKALMDYISNVTDAILSEFSNVLKPLRALMVSLEEALQACADDSPVDARLLETLLFGVPSESMKKFLADSVSERLVKAWKKSAGTGYENIRKLVAESLIPACERAVVMLTRICGLAEWRERGTHLGLNVEAIENIISRLQEFMTAAHRLLWETNTEYDYFKNFVGWFKYMLDEMSSTEVPDEEVDTKIESTKVATFITEYLGAPTVKQFFSSYAEPVLAASKSQPIDSGTPDWAKNDSSGRKIFNQDFQPVELRTMIKDLDKLCVHAFTESANAMKKHAVFGSPLRIKDNCNLKKMQACTRVVAGEGDGSELFVAISFDVDAEAIMMIKVQILKHHNELTKPQIHASLLSCAGQRLQSMTFVDDEKMMFLFHATSPDSSSPPQASLCTFTTSDAFPDASLVATDILSDGDLYHYLTSERERLVPEWADRRAFTEEFVPVALAVNGRPGRRVAAVLADDRQRYMVFDIDDNEEDEEEEGDDMPVD
ncbi:anaphase-promoting complex, cyclosome, subunit 4-domain-containing protein [Myxozyma melibiosi]|uniref:Anaphase-promoting complex subunit 4 n=1 Tax=Myxozyma melibiosi TaxID=54550 RepID=A0ABR1F1T9_9ASCO